MKRFLLTLFIGMLASGLCYGEKRPSRNVAASEMGTEDMCTQIANGQSATGEMSQERLVGKGVQNPPAKRIEQEKKSSEQPSDASQ